MASTPRGRCHAAAALVVATLIATAQPLGAHGDGDHEFDPSVDLPIVDATPGLTAAAVPGAPLVIASDDGPEPPVGVFPPLNTPPVASAATADGSSFWIAASDGGVFAFGDADFYGSLGGIALNEPVVAMSTTPTGDGYWMAASDGGIFAFGGADFYGSLGAIPLNEPIVAMLATPTGEGYWMIASDGGVFAFGDADFFGSLGGDPPASPIVDMELSDSGDGYWLLAADGSVYAFGDAVLHGASPADRTEDPATAIVRASSGSGYHVLTETGSVLSFGSAPTITTPGVTAPDLVIDASAVPGGLWLTVGGPRDHVSVWQSGGFADATLDAIAATGDSTQARVAVLHRLTLTSAGVTRGDQWIQQVRTGWRIPFSTMAVPLNRAETVVGADIAAALAAGDVALSARSARFREAQVGDSIIVYDSSGRQRRLRIGAIAPDRRMRGSEIVLTVEALAGLGLSRPSTALLIGPSPGTTLSVLRSRLPAGFIRSVRTGDVIDADGILSSIRLKEEFGEVEYLPASNGTVTLASDWVSESISAVSVPIIGRINCNNKIVPDLTAALEEVQAQGLSGLINASDSRRNGGCWVPRLIRGPSGGTLSRHSYGIAMDINPSTNPFGATPTMDSRIVEIFRAHGFAWGGGWTRPDGMHFEWVGSDS